MVIDAEATEVLVNSVLLIILQETKFLFDPFGWVFLPNGEKGGSIHMPYSDGFAFSVDESVGPGFWGELLTVGLKQEEKNRKAIGQPACVEVLKPQGRLEVAPPGGDDDTQLAEPVLTGAYSADLGVA